VTAGDYTLPFLIPRALGVGRSQLKNAGRYFCNILIPEERPAIPGQLGCAFEDFSVTLPGFPLFGTGPMGDAADGCIFLPIYEVVSGEEGGFFFLYLPWNVRCVVTGGPHLFHFILSLVA